MRPLIRTIAGYLIGVALACSSQAAEKLNVLWLIGEDISTTALSGYGQKLAKNPNLEQMARDGVLYTHAYTTAPVCSPSRSAIITGMYQTSIGAHNHRSHRNDGYRLPADVKIITELMRDAGYFTANVVQMPASIGFRGTGKTDWNFTPPAYQFDSKNWDDLAKNQPFFAQINFNETHRAFKAPKMTDPAAVELPPYYPDHPVTRADYAAYIDSGNELDRKIGVILAQLEKEGLAENTVVMFFGDNGEAHVRAKQFCYEEGLHVPMIVRWPKGKPVPQNFKPGEPEPRFIEAIDLAPTTLAIAGAPVPGNMQGRVFLGDKMGAPRQYVFGARDRCDETVFRLRTVRDGRYRYIRNFTPDRPFLQPNAYKERQYPVWNLLKELDAQGKLTPVQKVLTAATMPEEELYDLEADPHEIANLAGKPEHAETQKRLKIALDRWIDETKDQGATLEPEELVRSEGRTQKVAPTTKPE
jgi:N-sulfoglucosamine sulfohydrolase